MDIEKRREKSRKYYHQNKEKHLVLRRQWWAFNESAYLGDLYRARIRMVLGNRLRRPESQRRARGAEMLLGCTLVELMAHLEAQWLPGMNWDNYGSEWVMDHLQSCSSFDLTDPLAALFCFNVNNVQPMFRRENQIKFTS